MFVPLEGLEGRRLLSASVFFSPTTGKFFVNGDASDDVISVSVSGASYHKGQGITVKDHGAVIFDQDVAGVTNLYVYSKAGSDTVNVGTYLGVGNVLISTSDGDDTVSDSSLFGHGHAIYTGDGNDTIIASVAGATLGAYLNTGNGDDEVTVKYSAYYAAQGSTVVGGAGDDAITFVTTDLLAYATDRHYGTNAAYGGDGNDTINGSTLDEYLCGGAGNDSIIGGAGVDFLRGGTDDDFLSSSGDGPDRVEQGGGNDTVDADPGDQVL